MAVNRQVLLAAAPSGLPRLGDFSMRSGPVPEPQEGQLLIRHLYLGLSPSGRIRMGGDSDYGPGMALGDVVGGQTVGVVEKSRNPAFREGEYLLCNGGWQDYSLTRGGGAQRLDPGSAPLADALGLLGTSGMTAYVGLLDLGAAASGETLVVSAASGSVGSLVGQMGKILGCRVVGITGGERKSRYLLEELGFDAAVDHRAADFAAALARACPAGVDVYFDNVGGAVRDAVWPLMANFGRIVLCGMIAEYGQIGGTPGPNWFPILSKRLTLRGFLLRDHEARRADFQSAVTAWRAQGRIKYRYDETAGLEHAPAAFIRMLAGENFGKSIVKIGDE